MRTAMCVVVAYPRRGRIVCRRNSGKIHPDLVIALDFYVMIVYGVILTALKRSAACVELAFCIGSFTFPAFVCVCHCTL